MILNTFHLEPKDLVTISIAAVGAVLGIINTWSGLNQRKVKLRVVPKWAYAGPDLATLGCIEVTNLSAFAITIREIGFTMKGDSIKKHKRLSILDPITADHKPFARRLESRESISGYFELTRLHPDMNKAYARTDCEEVAYGTSPASRQIRQKVRESYNA